MNSKTPAEQQLEYLKKLRDQKKPGRATAKAATGIGEAQVGQARPRKAAGKMRRGRARYKLPVSASTWKRLQAAAKSDKNFKPGLALGNWAVELVLNLPPGLRKPPVSGREELFRKIREWLRTIDIN